MDMTEAITATALYAGLNTLIGLALAMNVGRIRGSQKVFMGDGGNPLVIRAMRGHANFIENAPLGLLLLLLTAMIGAPVWLIHVLGLMLTFGRAFHAVHFIKSDAPGWQRAAGAGLSFLMLALTAIGLIGHAIYGILA